jgi:phage terminase large subunit GpA-like protein
VTTAARPTPRPDAAALSRQQRRAADRRAAAAEAGVVRSRLRPPPRLTVSAWANRYRVLSPESSARPGRFSTEDAPYQVEFMDACGDPRYARVVAMWASQLGKTECVNNVVGFKMHQAPAPVLIMQPTLEMAEAWSKDRLAPMIRDTPCLTKLVADARSRDSGNTLLHKQGPGFRLTMCGANSPASLAARPIETVLCDEIDRYPPSAGAEGDPRALAWRRTSTFPNRKQIEISTPTVKGFSNIERAYAASDRRRWFVPCPHCAHEQVLEWGGRDTGHGVKWEPGRPETAHYVCVECGCVIEEWQKRDMNARGRWVAEDPEATVAGFWLNALVSPYYRWADAAQDWIDAQGDTLKLRAFVNTVLCEPWEEAGDEVKPETLTARLGVGYGDLPAGADVPAGAGVLTRSVDVQGDRLETAVWAWGAGEQAWLVDFLVIPGDPGTPGPWAELDAEIAREYVHAGGSTIRPSVTFVDSGGHHAKEVYAFTRRRVRQRVYAIKGASTEGAPLLARPTRNNAARAILYLVGTFTGKESVMSRLARVVAPGPGFVHLPEWLDGEQVAQLTAEKLVTRYVGGRPKRAWAKTRERNEMLDLFVYALAALQKLGPKAIASLGRYAQRRAGAAAAARRAAPETPPVPDPAGQGGDALQEDEAPAGIQAPEPEAPDEPEVPDPAPPPPPAGSRASARPTPRPRGRGGWVGGWRK